MEQFTIKNINDEKIEQKEVARAIMLSDSSYKEVTANANTVAVEENDKKVQEETNEKDSKKENDSNINVINVE